MHSFLPLLTQDIVSQFTLLASTKKGNKPDFHKSASAAQAIELYGHFFAKVQELYREGRVKNGVFQAEMDVGLVNDGPVGVDYSCVDEQVNCPVCPFGSLNLPLCSHNHLFADSVTGHYYNRHQSA